MKIGIVVHSKTGNTLSVAELLKEKLAGMGHEVDMVQVSADNDSEQKAEYIRLKSIPDISKYDSLVFGAPVRGMALSAVMQAYLSRVSNLQGKKVACFVTQFFPLPSMGGNSAMAQFEEICKKKAARIYGTGIINWTSLSRKKKIADLMEAFSKIS